MNLTRPDSTSSSTKPFIPMTPIVLLVCFLVCQFTPSRAAADITIDITQTGSNVVATEMGTVNTTDLTSIGTSNAADQPFLDAQIATLVMGGTAGVSTNELIYSGISGPGSWGPGTFVLPTAASGDHFGLDGNNGRLVTPQGYISGTQLMGTATFSGTTISTLGLNKGTYVYTWGSGSAADSLTVRIGTVSAVPEPSTAIAAVFGAVAFVGYGWSRRRRDQRRQAAA
jgi:hypothetical protein